MFPYTIHEVLSAPAHSKTLSRDFKRNRGMREFGAGAFGAVYGSEYSDTVTKVTYTNDWGYLAFLEEIRPYSGTNPWLPRIYSVDVYMDQNGDTAIVVKMERLDRRWTAFGAADPGYEAPRETAHQIRSHSYGHETSEWITNNPELTQALELIDRAQKKSSCSKDLHGGNIMMRGENQVVITDPLGFPD